MDLNLALEGRAKVEQFQQKHRIGLLTLVFTDLVGSTKLKQELGDKPAVALIQSHHALVRRLLNGFAEGEEISTSGDSFFIVFAKPSDAVQFSLRLQAELREMSQSQLARRPVLDRVGIHIGEVLIEHTPELGRTKDLYGLQVDICARVMSLAEGDQILLTRSAFDNARQVLKGRDIRGFSRVHELQWLNHGPYLLKGVEEPLEICEVGEVGAAVLKPPPDSEKVHRHVSPDADPVLGWRPALEQVVPGTQWQLEEKLGEGGFGEVWLGAHPTLKERRVFKFCFRADRVRSLRREVTIFRLLKERAEGHPNLVRLHDVFFDEPPYYIVTEYVPGRDLKSWSEQRGGLRRIPLADRLEIVAQVADALQAAHESGVIHRDIKPSNILVESREPRVESQTGKARPSTLDPRPTIKLTDFGIGQVVSQEALAGVTRLGFTQTMMSSSSSVQTGTHLYMAPEILAGKPASIPSDLYSLGVVLYQMLAVDWSRPLPSDWSKDVIDLVLRDLLASCLAGDPQQRIASAGELANKLRAFEPDHRIPAVARSRNRIPRIQALGCLAPILVFILMPVVAQFVFEHKNNLWVQRKLPGLITKLGHPESGVRQEAAQTIGRIRKGAEPAAPALKKALKDQETSVRIAAAQALVGIGIAQEEATAMLIDLLRDESPRNRYLAARALAEVERTRGDVPLALAEATKSSDWRVRWQSLRSIGEIRRFSPVVVSALLEALDSPDPLSRQAAAAALQAAEGWDDLSVSHGQEPGESSGSESRERSERKPSPIALEVSAALSKMLRDANAGVRRRAAEALKHIDPKALAREINTLLEKLRDPAWQTRTSAISALDSIRSIGGYHTEEENNGQRTIRWVDIDEVIVPSLVNALDDESDMVRAAAAKAVRTQWNLRADTLTSLIRALRDPAPTVRAAAAAGLEGTYYASPQMSVYVSSALMTLLKDESAAVRCQAAVSLRGFADSNSKHLVAPLTVALADEIPLVREAAAEMLGRIGPAAKTAIPALTESAKSRFPQFRHCANVALKRIQR